MPYMAHLIIWKMNANIWYYHVCVEKHINCIFMRNQIVRVLSFPHLFLPPRRLHFIFLFRAPREVASFQETFTYEVSLKNKSHPSSLSSIVCNHLHPSSSHPLPSPSIYLSFYLSTHPFIHPTLNRLPLHLFINHLFLSIQPAFQIFNPTSIFLSSQVLSIHLYNWFVTLKMVVWLWNIISSINHYLIWPLPPPMFDSLNCRCDCISHWPDLQRYIFRSLEWYSKKNMFYLYLCN